MQPQPALTSPALPLLLDISLSSSPAVSLSVLPQLSISKDLSRQPKLSLSLPNPLPATLYCVNH